MSVQHRRPLDVAEAATYLGTSARHVRQLVATRRIPYLKVGRLVRFRPEALDAWLEENTVEPVRRLAR